MRAGAHGVHGTFCRAETGCGPGRGRGRRLTSGRVERAMTWGPTREGSVSGTSWLSGRATWRELRPSKAQIRPPHVRIARNLGGRAGHDDAAGLQHIGAIGDFQAFDEALLESSNTRARGVSRSAL